MGRVGWTAPYGRGSGPMCRSLAGLGCPPGTLPYRRGSLLNFLRLDTKSGTDRQSGSAYTTLKVGAWEEREIALGYRDSRAGLSSGNQGEFAESSLRALCQFCNKRSHLLRERGSALGFL